MTPRLLSVIVPTFNRAALLRETLACLVSQQYRPLEVIVIDDCSSDDTVEQVQRFMDECSESGLSLRLLRLDQNSGPAHARNIGFNLAGGEYILFNDSDDLIDRHKLSLQIEALDRDPSLDFVYGPTRILETGLPVFGAVYLNPLQACIRQLRSPFFHTMGPVFRRSFLAKAGKWNPKLPPFDDWEYHLRLAYQRPHYQWVPKAQAYYRSQGQGPEGRISAARKDESASERYALGQYRRIVSAIHHAPDWVLHSTLFRRSLRWNAYRVLSICVRSGLMELARDILERLAAKQLPRNSAEHLVQSALGTAFSLSPRGFRMVFATCDFIYFRFWGVAKRIQRVYRHRERKQLISVSEQLSAR
jgi:glycosyltransferase involved in cell wall biosynthesis